MTEPLARPNTAYYPPFPDLEPVPDRRRVALVVGAAVVALALVIGTLVALGRATHSTSNAAGAIGAGPERVVPADAVGFVKLKVALDVDQKRAVARVVNAFPAAPRLDPADPIGSLLQQQTAAPVDYGRDIAPWIGESVGVAVFPGKTGPVLAVYAETRDDGAAKAFFERSRSSLPAGEGAYALINHVAILARSAADLAAALPEGRARLKDDDRYRAALRQLSGNQAATVYVDLTRAISATPAALRRRVTGVELLGALVGQVALGVRFDGDVAQFEGVLANGNTSLLKGAKTDLLQKLPANTPLALSVAHSSSYLNALLFVPRIGALVQRLERQSDLSFASDVAPLLADVSVLAVASTPAGGRVGLVTRVPDAVRARTVATSLERAFGQVHTDVRERTLFAAVDASYLTELTAAGRLGASDTFRKAMGDLGDAVALALFVDYDALRKLAPQIDRPEARDVRALGLIVTVHDGAALLRLRVVVK